MKRTAFRGGSIAVASSLNSFPPRQAEALAELIPDIQFIVKPATETVNTSDTIQADDHFLFPVAAGGKYLISGILATSTGGTPGIKFDLGGGTCSAHAVNLLAHLHVDNAASQAEGTTTGLTTAVGAAVAASRVTIHAFVHVNAGGTLGLRWAQNVSDASDTSVLLNSVLRCERVG